MTPHTPERRKAKIFSGETDEGLPFMQFTLPRYNAAIYVRVSTQDQAEGLSLPAQTRRLKERAKQKGWIIPDGCVYTELVSAEALVNRPHMLRALKDAQNGLFDVFMVVYQNRLARNTMDALLIAKQFLDCGAKIWVDDKARVLDITKKTDMFEFTVFGAMDAYERMDIKDRMAMGREQARLSGRGWVGGPAPYGYRQEPINPIPARGPKYRLVIDKKEAKILRDYVFGKPEWSSHRVALFLNKKGIKPRRAKGWNPKQITRMRTNRLYCGEYEYKGKIFKAKDVPAIISKAIWLRMQALLRRGLPFSKSPKHLLAGIAYCGYCDSKFYLHWHNNPKNRQPYGSYFCSSRAKRFPPCTKSRRFTAWIVHEKLLANLTKKLSDPEFLERIRNRYSERKVKTDSELDGLEKEFMETDKRRQRLVTAIADGTITQEDAASHMNEVRRRQREILNEMSGTVERSQEVPSLETLRVAAERIGSLDSDSLRILIRALVERVTFYQKAMTVNYRFWGATTLKVRIRP